MSYMITVTDENAEDLHINPSLSFANDEYLFRTMDTIIYRQNDGVEHKILRI